MGKNNNEGIQNITALIFDRFYCGKPNVALAVLGRAVVAAAISFLAMGYVFGQYAVPVDITALSLISMGAAAVFSLLFAFVRKRIAIPVLSVVCALIVLLRLDELWKRLSYFTDAFLLEFNGRIFDLTQYTVHPSYAIMRGGKYTHAFVEAAMFGCIILCILFAFITAAGLIGKPNILPSLSVFLILWIPRLAAERLLFDWRLIPLTALYAGAVAISVYYRDGMAIRHGYMAGGYRRRLAMENKRFDVSIRTQSSGKRAASRNIRYSKYFSSVMSAAAIFAALGIILNIVFEDSIGIDYQPLYNALQNIDGPFGTTTSPFKDGPEASYFTSPQGSTFSANGRLRLTAPSNDTRDIIRVTKSISEKPVYLRGDIGIDFDGTSWSSPVTEEPAEWRSSGFAEQWLPIEMTALDADDFTSWYVACVWLENVSVEYLCNTNVVFAPPYDKTYDIFSRGRGLSVYGDYVARRGTAESVHDTMKYIAYVADYTNPKDEHDIKSFASACEAYGFYRRNSMDSILGEVSDMLGRTSGKITVGDYETYVKKHYLGVPEALKPRLDLFIEQSGLSDSMNGFIAEYGDMFSDFSDDTQMMAVKFLSAAALSRFLRENYTYSLTAAINNSDPVMSFLNDAKSGHCALYASSMVLILRELGIPARYCTGFVASSELEMQTLRTKDLHAWCEVYLDELGWVTFDPTPGTGGNGGEDTSSISSDSEPQSTDSGEFGSSESGDSSGEPSEPQSTDLSFDSSEEPSDSSQIDDTRDSGETSSDTGSVTFTQLLPYLLTILAVFIAAALITLGVRVYLKIKKRAYKIVQSLYREENSELVYKMLLEMLALCGLRPRPGEQPCEFFERAEEALEIAVAEYCGLFERIAFGGAELDVSERAVLGGAFEKIFRACEGKFILFGKLRLRILVIKLYKK